MMIQVGRRQFKSRKREETEERFATHNDPSSCCRVAIESRVLVIGSAPFIFLSLFFVKLEIYSSTSILCVEEKKRPVQVATRTNE